MMYGRSSQLTSEELNEYKMYVLAKQYGIRPWEYNEDGEKYPEDLNSLIAFAALEAEAGNKQEAAAAAAAKLKR